MWVHMQVESLAIDIEDGSGRKKNEEKNLPCFVCRKSPADAQFKQKSAARKDGLKIQLEGKVIGTSF